MPTPEQATWSRRLLASEIDKSIYKDQLDLITQYVKCKAPDLFLKMEEAGIFDFTLTDESLTPVQPAS